MTEGSLTDLKSPHLYRAYLVKVCRVLIMTALIDQIFWWLMKLTMTSMCTIYDTMYIVGYIFQRENDDRREDSITTFTTVF